MHHFCMFLGWKLPQSCNMESVITLIFHPQLFSFVRLCACVFVCVLKEQGQFVCSYSTVHNDVKGSHVDELLQLLWAPVTAACNISAVSPGTTRCQTVVNSPRRTPKFCRMCFISSVRSSLGVTPTTASTSGGRSGIAIVQEGEMDGACGKHGRHQKCIQNFGW
jgi:hypothetical protein